MKKFNLTKKLLMVLLIIFTTLSFAPCLLDVTHWFDIPANNLRVGEYTYEEHNYMPVFCLVISTIEIGLLLLKHFAFRIIGLILNLLKTLCPPVLFAIDVVLLQTIGGLSSHECDLSVWGHIIIAVGIIISALYIIDLISTYKNYTK